MLLLRSALSLCLMLLSSALFADSVEKKSVEEKIVAGLKAWRADLNYTHIVQTPVEGLYHVQVVGGPPIYVSEDGGYFIQGDLLRTQPGGVTIGWRDSMLAPLRKGVLDKADVSQMVVFKPQGEIKAVISVFTDIDCGFCRKLHAEVPALNQMGIEVRYLAFPRAGLGSSSANKLETVWCAANPQQAMTAMKQGGDLPIKSCGSPAIPAHFELVAKLGINATPAIVLADGTLVSGYRRAGEMKQILGL